ncbi:hypothetical protein [Spiroplasma cantharicola]|uniref:Uncharacterized protein n=1 Tax=Spiroplasma cantharicola TaxID=362837 RepID=A0A0M3SJG8_9MOLU|nr:hypothetical protein [Spiroplasma cantharicola]ALD66728.1 hypothetical protein SCANT_v1c08220 [Spiroplasma cantharicola]
MKKMLSVWLSLGLTVSTGVSVVLKDENKNINKYSKFLTSLDDFLYLKVEKEKSVDKLSNKQIEKILKEAFSINEFGINLYKKIDYEILNQEDGELNILFKDKQNSNILNEKIIIKFNLVLFNYDKINDAVYILNNYLFANPLIINKSKYIQIELEDLLKNKFKRLFDRYISSNIFLKSVNEFWEFLDFEEVKNQKNDIIKANFLNNTNLDFRIMRDASNIGVKKSDKYITYYSDKKLMNKEIFNWIKKYSFFNEEITDYNNIFKIESKDEKQITFSLSKKYFNYGKLITLEIIKGTF